ncbi:glycosyltransferase family 2 protein [Pirellulaceae bacterium SH449]
MTSTIEDATVPLISIAIATYNRSALLRRALESLSQLEPCTAFRTEVVVIDNGSTDDTRDIAISFSSPQFPVRWFFEEKGGLPFARNRAVEESRGDWIAFFDDDQLAAPNWLKRLFETAQAEKLLCVGGPRALRIETTEPPPSLPEYSRMLLGEISLDYPHDYHRQHLPCTGNVLVARSVFAQVGRFDESVLDGGEDTDFFNRVLDAGVRAKYTPDACVEHIIAPRRLEADYLQLIAYRHGRHVCRRDLNLHGKMFAVGSALLRSGVTGLPSIAKKILYQIRGKQHEAIATACKWSRVCGYWSYLKRELTTAVDNNTRTMHRGKG